MLRRRWAAGVLSCAIWGAAWSHARGEASPAFKSDPTPPEVSANTLFVEAEKASEQSAKPGGDVPSAEPESPVVPAKYRPQTCAAVALQIPRHGVRVVTAAHCAGEELALFDGQRWLSPRATTRAIDGSDLALLDFAAPAWSGLATRPASSVAVGERLCAWHVTRAGSGLRRESICGRLLERRDRASGYPWLVVGHPYPCGTSGSPLVDAEGRAVGVVVASDGMAGFAEPIEAVFAIAAGAPSTGARVGFMRP